MHSFVRLYTDFGSPMKILYFEQEISANKYEVILDFF